MITAAMMRHGMEAIFNPFFMGVALFVCLLLWLCLRGDSFMLRVGFFVVLAGLLLLSTAWFPRMMINKVENQYAVITDINPAIHWVVVFSGGQMIKVNAQAPANQLLNEVSIKRLVEAVRLYHHLPHAKLILSGGSAFGDTISEASRLATVVSWFGISADDVLVEGQSVNTADEAIAIKRWVKKEPFYLVTSAIHLPRAMALCRKQGLNPIAAPSDYPYTQQTGWQKDMMPDARNIVHVNTAWHELLGWIWGVASSRTK